METRYKVFPACRKRASAKEHTQCTGAYIGKFHDAEGKHQLNYNSNKKEYFEVRWQCSCPHHKMSNASVQGDFFKQESAKAPRFEEQPTKQGNLFQTPTRTLLPKNEPQGICGRCGTRATIEELRKGQPHNCIPLKADSATQISMLLNLPPDERNEQIKRRLF